MHHFDEIYPFSAIVGQEQMKKALLLNAINPKIGGVLIRGEGDGKIHRGQPWRTYSGKGWWWKDVLGLRSGRQKGDVS